MFRSGLAQEAAHVLLPGPSMSMAARSLHRLEELARARARFGQIVPRPSGFTGASRTTDSGAAGSGFGAGLRDRCAFAVGDTT